MKIGVLSIHGWDQQHFNSEGKRVANIGDSIREVVMMQIIEECGVSADDIVVIGQNEIGDYDGPEIRLIFDDMINDNEFIDQLAVNKKIHPVFVSCFFYDDIFAGRADRVEFFKKHEPIGCRDEHSKELCIKNGIDAYLVGCFTLCVPRKDDALGEKIYVVDGTQTVRELLPKDIRDNAEYISHAVEIQEYPITKKESERLYNIAKQYLDNYRKNAKLVISGRLHATIPSFAMGIPAVIINQNFNYKFGWVDKWLKLYDKNLFDNIDFCPKYNESLYEELDKVRVLIKGNIKHALTNGTNSISNLKLLDKIYMDRAHQELNTYFKDCILADTKRYSESSSFRYSIWGAGLNGGYVYQIMNELYPNATLVSIIDKYKTGTKYGVPIISSSDLKAQSTDHVIVSSAPAIPEAVKVLENLYDNSEERHYSIAVTAQNC